MTLQQQIAHQERIVQECWESMSWPRYIQALKELERLRTKADKRCDVIGLILLTLFIGVMGLIVYRMG